MEHKTHTITYQGTVSALRHNKKQEINYKLEELNSILDDGDNEDEIEQLENELKDLMDEMLHEQSSFFKNHELLNDCKITKDFIKLESRKGRYNHEVKLNTRDANGDIIETITDPVEIRGKMASTFQNIFNEQNVNRTPSSIENFLLLDNDEEPINELERTQIQDHIKN